jgi:myo-inositol-1(or 4)-monophosphatase
MSEFPVNFEPNTALEGDFVNQKTLHAIVNAGKKAMEVRSAGLTAEEKTSKEDIVTMGDIAVSSALASALTELFPDIKIIDEEVEGSHKLNIDEGLFAVIDPIDGTTNYFNGDENWATSLGFLKDGVLVGGIIYQPQTGSLFYAEKGKGAFKGDRRISVSETTSFDQSSIVFDYPYPKDKLEYETIGKIETILRQKGFNPTKLGSQVVELSRVADGSADFFFMFATKPWDIAAGVVIVEEAGGRSTNFKGLPYKPFEKSIVLSNGALELSPFYDLVAGLGVAPSL